MAARIWGDAADEVTKGVAFVKENPLSAALTLGVGLALTAAGVATRNGRLISRGIESLRSGSVSGAISRAVTQKLAASSRVESEDVFALAARTSNADMVRIPHFDFNALGEKRPAWLEQRRDSPLAQMYAQNSKSAVRILSMNGRQVVGTGSGFIVQADGLIATNFHVAANSPVLAIETSSKDRFYAQPIAPDVMADLALLRVINKPESMNFIPVTLGETGSLRQGSLLTAIGHPDGVEPAVLGFWSF